MRKLSSEELVDGLFVQCLSVFGSSILEETSPTIYQIIIKENRFFYKAKDSNWEMSGDLVKNVWYETELTKSLNRERKIKELGI